MVVWTEVDQITVIGAIAGYSGGGSFEVERFKGITGRKGFKSLWIDYTDRITDKEIDLNSLTPEDLLICENSLDEIWKINDSDIWNSTDNVVMKEEKKNTSLFSNDLFFIDSPKPSWMKQLCELVGLIAYPP
jgi:hypothetical protein